MADEELNENEEQEQEEIVKPAGGKKTLIMVAVGVIMLVIAVILVVFVIYPKYQQMMGVESDTEEVEEKKKEGPLEVGEIFKIEGLTVNPRGSLGSRFERVNFRVPRIFSSEMELYARNITRRLRTTRTTIAKSTEEKPEKKLSC